MSDNNLSIRNVPPIQSKFSSNDLTKVHVPPDHGESKNIDIFDDPESPMCVDITTSSDLTPTVSPTNNLNSTLRERKKYEKFPSDHQADFEVIVDSKDNIGQLTVSFTVIDHYLFYQSYL